MSPLDVFFRDKGIFVFFAREGEGQYHACNAYAYIQKISHFHALFYKDHLLSFSAQRKNIIFSGKKKYHLSRYYKKDRVQVQISWKDHLFKTVGKRKYGFPCSAINDPNTIETKFIFETIVLFNLSLFLSASPLVLHYQNLALIGFSLLFPDFELPNLPVLVFESFLVSCSSKYCFTVCREMQSLSLFSWSN